VSERRRKARSARGSRIPRAEYVLPLTILLAAVLLGISQFMTIFDFTPPGAEPLRSQLATDQHGYALLLLAICTVVAMIWAMVSGLRPAAIATAAFGLVALLLFLVLDLPDAGKLGDLEDPTRGLASARAEPQSGFWLEAVSSVVLGLAAVVFATLNSEQLRAPLDRWRGRQRSRTDSKPDPRSNGDRGKGGEKRQRQRA
jgi:amino acid transporter